MRAIKKSIIYFFIAAIIYFLPRHLAAQSENRLFYNFKTFTTADGLNSNRVICVYKDSRGFLWIGTDRGVQRYNGSAFLSFRHLNNDTNSIASEIVNSITEDKDHNIWIATYDGITRFSYSNGKLINFSYGYRDGHKIKLGEVFCFFEDSQGRQWIGTIEAGLYVFDKMKCRFVHYPPAAYLGLGQDFFGWVSGIQETAKKELVFSLRSGFAIVDKEGRQQYFPIPKPTGKQIIYLPCGILPLLKEYPNEIWVASTVNGLYKYNRVSKIWTHYTSGNLLQADHVSVTTAWGENEWLLGYHNLCFFNHRTGIFTEAFDAKKINSINGILRDNDGNVWMASSTEGLHLLNLSTQLFSSAQAITGLGKDRLIYFDTMRQRLYSINPYYTQSSISWQPATKAIARDTIPWFFKNHKVLNNFIADNNILYFAMHGGMWKFDLNKHRLDSIVYKDRFSNSQNWSFPDICKSPKNIYFTNGTYRGGPFAYNKVTHLITDLSIAPTGGSSKKNHDHCIAFSNEILYIGTWNADSILCFNEATGQRSAIGIPANYRNDKLIWISGLCIDKNQNLWCASFNNGIYVYNIASQKWIRHISQSDDYYVNSVNQMVCDEDGTVWCNSSEGLFAFNPNNFNFKNYKEKDGLLSESEGGFLAVLPGHQVAYNNIQGDDISYGLINTKRADTLRQIISISITNLRVLGKAFLEDTLLDNVNKVTLPSNNNAFSL